MAVNLVTIAESDFSSGADSSSAESNIKETFVQDAQNCIPDMGGSLITRKGYITYGGGIPFRVISSEPLDKKIRLTLDRAVSVASLAKQPIMVYGRTGYQYMASGTAISELKSDSDKWLYITAPTTDIPSVIPNMTTETDPAGTVTLESFKTGFTQSDVIIGVAQTYLGSPVNSVLTLNTENINLNTSTLTLTAKFVNYTGVSKYFYIYYVDPTALSEPYMTDTFTSSDTWTLATAGSSLNNNNFIVRCYNIAGDVIVPDTLSFDDITGIITANFSEAISGRMIVITADTADFHDIAVPPSNSANIPVEVEIPAEVVIVDVYKQVGNTFTQVCPQSITFDASAEYPLSVLVENPSSTDSVSLRVFWKKAEQAARSVVTIPIAEDCTGQPIDNNPQLVIYGPDHAEVYAAGSGERAGWVSHVDRYRTAETDRMVAALGHNVFHEIPILATDTDHYVKHYLSLRSRALVAGTIEIGPALSSTSPRTTANILSSGVSATNTLFANTITQAAELVTFTTSLVGTLTGSLSDLGTHVTISQAPNSDLFGEHEIVSIAGVVDAGAISEISITIRIARGVSIDYSKYSGIPIEWGIFTDVIELGSPSRLLPNDRVYLSGFETTFTDTYVVSTYQVASRYFMNVKGIIATRQIPNRMLIIGERVSTVIPMRDFYELGIAASGVLAVPGDMIQISNVTEEQRVKCVTVYPPTALTIQPVATINNLYYSIALDVTGTTFNTGSFKAGDKILLTNCGTYAGEYDIASIESATQLTLAAKAINANNGTVILENTWIQGSLIEIYGEPITLIDSLTNANYLEVPRRWVPVEPPTEETFVKQFLEAAYTEQPFVRSVMSQDSMFFTNGVDPLFKYDGLNYTRAGLPRFNPYLMVNRNTASGVSAKISFPTARAELPSAAKWSGLSHGSFYTVPGGTSEFAVGDIVCSENYNGWGYTAGGRTTITGITKGARVEGAASGTEVPVDIIQFDAPITTATPDPYDLVICDITYKYYFRFNLIDANNNVIASAVLGSQDVVVRLAGSARVEFRLAPLPIFSQFDYSRLEVEVYRTKKNQSAPFYRISNIEVPYPILDYIDVYDSTEDALLTDLDYTTSVLEGQELLLGNSLPPLARCITTANNRLLLGATTSHPTVSLSWQKGIRSEVGISDFDDVGVELTVNSNSYKLVMLADYATGVNVGSVVNASYSSGTVTITYTNGSFDVEEGQWVYLTRNTGTYSNNVNLRYAGWRKVEHRATGVSTTQITFIAGNPTDSTVYADAFDPAVDANLIYAINLNGYRDCVPVPIFDDSTKQTREGLRSTQWQNPVIITATQALGQAINALSAFSNNGDMFWAEWGNDVTPGIGTIVIRMASTVDTVKFFSIASPAVSINARIFANNLLIPSADIYTSTTAAKSIFRGSRIVKSYRNYPENFDNPDAESSQTSAGVIDVNPADGQTITAMIPLIGPSTSSSSQLQGTVIVFKERSIYAVDVEANTFEKLETNGVGAPYPNSVAYTKSGLAFASESGIYRLDRNLKISKISGNISRQWGESDLADTDNFHGHHTAKDSQYKLSTPENKVMVYNYEREVEGKPGAWCEYTNHPVAGGWANQGNYEFFASTMGRVFINRHTGTVTDYRDDSNTGIDLDIKFRPMHFGDAAIRKQVRHANISFRNTAQLSDNIDVSCAFDCSTDFNSLDSFQTEVSANATISSIRFGIPTGRLTYLQLRIQSDTIDEPIEVAGVTYKVAGLQVAGTKEAKTSKGNN